MLTLNIYIYYCTNTATEKFNARKYEQLQNMILIRKYSW